MTRKLATTCADYDAARNRRIMIWRHENRIAELELMAQVNHDWRDRAWGTPDVAMCLGRYKSAKQERKFKRA